nr:tetratricopeptide repeat protein [Deinococcus sp. JMULE3]
MDLPAHLHPFEALLPQEHSPARVDALLELSAHPHPLLEQVALAEQARALAASLNDPARTARAELRLGHLLSGPEGLAQVRSAARRFEQLRDVDQELACALREAALLDDPHAQLGALLRAAELAEEAGQALTELDVQVRLGEHLRALGRAGRAAGAFTRAAELAEAHDARVQATGALLGLGELHLDDGHPQAALEPLRAAGHLTRGEGTAGQARALGGLGRAHAAQGDPERAARFLDAALPLAERLGEPALHATLLDARAGVHGAQGQPQEAHALLRRSLALTEQSRPDEHGRTLLALAAHLAGQGDTGQDQTAQARDTLGWALRYGLEHDRPGLIAGAHLALADLAETQQDMAEAAAQLRAWAASLDGQRRRDADREAQVQAAAHAAREALACRAARRETLHLIEGSVQDASTRLAAMQVMLERWRSTSMLDTESGAHSRPFGLEVLALHFNRCVRLRAPLTLAIVGVEVQAPPTDGPADLFTSNVLSAVARVLEGQVRTMDTVARFDRFKFMVIFPETLPDAATHPLERVIDAVQGYDWGVPGMQDAVSVAVGVVGRGFVQGVNLLVDAADAEQYRARRQGPNTLSVAR